MQDLLAQLLDGQPLTRDQAEAAFESIMSGRSSAAQTAGLLSLMQARPGGPTVDEIAGAATVMRAKATAVSVPKGLTAIDIVGTGGDHSGTFNISTAAALVTAAAGRADGVCVAKHGNRAVTSRSGASQVLEALGVTLTADGPTLTRCLDEAGICFCFAPHHHPAMKHAAPIRAELGFRTIFNLVGPLTNPAGVKRQLMGVYAGSMAEPMARVLAALGTTRAFVVNGRIPSPDGKHVDGFDEFSTCGPTTVAEVDHGNIRVGELDPTSVGLSYSHPTALRVDSPQSSAATIRKVFAGAQGPCRDVVILNAAAALIVAGLVPDFPEALDRAAATIDRGAATQTLEQLTALTKVG